MHIWPTLIYSCPLFILLALSSLSPAASADGQSLYQQQCIACHGKTAEGNQTLKAPNLAGQDLWYLENQLKAFKSGYRGSLEGDAFGAGMAAIAKRLDDEQIKQVAGFIHELEAKSPKPTLEGDIEKGKQYYQSLCGTCHGPGGKGNKSLNSPKLAGLADWYIYDQLIKFRNNQRGYHQDDRLGKQMKMMSGILPDNQSLKDVASYLSQQ